MRNKFFAFDLSAAQRRRVGITLKKVLSLCFIAILLASSFVSATETDAENKSVYDRAELLSAGETDELESLCETIASQNSIHIFIFTENSINGSRKKYLGDFYDSVYGKVIDAALLLINMDPSDRGVEMQFYGQCKFNISDDRTEAIFNVILPHLQDGSYFDAMKLFAENVDTYMNTAPTTDYRHTEEDNRKYEENQVNENDYGQNNTSDFLAATLRNLVISMVIGGVVVGIMAYNSGGKTTTNQATYLDSGSSRILGKWDRYLHTTTTKHPKPKQEDNNHTGGGGSKGGGFSSGGGVSSGGHSHSGGGGKF